MTEIINGPVAMPESLRKLLNGTKQTVPMKNDSQDLKHFLISR